MVKRRKNSYMYKVETRVSDM
uniref:Uncharacterized protein n=1 Tax=Rhizophora mucronata TaxID=61149 RepID=A0A2P2NXP4_RHIMU